MYENLIFRFHEASQKIRCTNETFPVSLNRLKESKILEVAVGPKHAAFLLEV